MALKEDLQADVKKIFADSWTTRNGTTVPDPSTVQLGNDAVNLDATILYADLDGSTNLVDTETATFAARIYKAYLKVAAKIIRAEGGVITAYDGDRIMAVYIGSSKNTSAVRAALKINYAVQRIINPALKSQFPGGSYQVKQVIGIDTCKLLVANTGIRGSNDLVWVGRAANHAAKMAALSPSYPIRISGDVYKDLDNSVKSPGGTGIWYTSPWNGNTIYVSSYEWPL